MIRRKMPASTGKMLSVLLKPKNFRIIVFSLGVGTVIFALYHLLYNNMSAEEEFPPTKLTQIEIEGHQQIFDGVNGNGPPVQVQVVKGEENNLRLGEPPLNNPDDDYVDIPPPPRIVTPRSRQQNEKPKPIHQQIPVNISSFKSFGSNNQIAAQGKCFGNDEFTADIDSSIIYPNLEFDGTWTRNKEFWDTFFEQRYAKVKKSSETPYLKVFVIPHSHTDPGWLKTFEDYYHLQTKNIIDNAVEKLDELPHMTFQFSEMSFLAKWFEHAHQTKKDLLVKHIRDGRIEIVTGGWVMTDEATVNLYSMIDQLIEGQQWAKIQLKANPKASWSVDPFGHGSTLPYLLQKSGIKYMVIQRIHYAWKKWLAEKGKGDFRWIQRYDRSPDANSIICHNNPFDIYSIKHSCGPHPQICLNFDFRNISGEYSENFMVFTPITQMNVKEKAELLLEQYGRTASLFPHNIAMISLGDDFRFDRPIEWDQQYNNYIQLFDYINANRDQYKAEVKFGTISEYFQAVEERVDKFDTFSGDFFSYSDIFSDSRPAYWTGYFSTRPFWKKFYRETESAVRGAEILFSLTYAWARQNNKPQVLKVLTHEYNNLVVARRWLGLFAHHDATTGTSKVNTMNDYGNKLLDAMQFALNIQMISSSALLFNQTDTQSLTSINKLTTDFELSNFGYLPKKLPLSLKGFSGKRDIPKKVVLYNSLGWKRSHCAKIVVLTPYVQVMDQNGNVIPSQLNPILDLNVSTYYTVISRDMFELTFLAELSPLSLSVFTISTVSPDSKNIAVPATVYCKNCTISGPGKIFDIDRIQAGDIQLSNNYLQVLFDRNTGLLQSIKKVKDNLVASTRLSFGGYSSIDFRSGAYLFKPDPHSEQKIPFTWFDPNVFIISGVISAEIFVSSPPITMSARIMQVGGRKMEEAIFIQNEVNLERYNAEVFLRVDSDLESVAPFKGQENERVVEEVPTFFTDQSGYTMERRQKVSKIRIEGNYYPVNTMSYLQEEKQADQNRRFSILVDRSHGFSSFEKGRLETLIERRTILDDARGMGEGVTDNRETISNYVLLLEKVVPQVGGDYIVNLPTISAHQLSQELSYPPSLFLYDDSTSNLMNSENIKSTTSINLITQELPCDSHLLNLRTLTEEQDFDMNFPSSKALLIIQKLAFYCTEGQQEQQQDPVLLLDQNDDTKCIKSKSLFSQESKFGLGINVRGLSDTTLTGIGSKALQDSQNIQVEPFEIKSLLVEF